VINLSKEFPFAGQGQFVGDILLMDDGLARAGTKGNVPHVTNGEEENPLAESQKPLALGPNGGLLGANGTNG
jgi:hypothetical protein